MQKSNFFQDMNNIILTKNIENGIPYEIVLVVTNFIIQKIKEKKDYLQVINIIKEEKNIKIVFYR